MRAHLFEAVSVLWTGAVAPWAADVDVVPPLWGPTTL